METTIAAPVGLNGVNQPNEVRKIQALLNLNRDRVPDGREIVVDGIAGPHTIATIKRFQRVVVGMSNPDGLVEPGGKTLQALNLGAVENGRWTTPSSAAPPMSIKIATALRFPLRRRPGLSYKGGRRYFGAPRKTSVGGYRAHAGCDLIAPKGTEILAVADGVVVADAYEFYSGTSALEIRHEAGFVVRYGEISGAAARIKAGVHVSRGQVIAYVGKLESGSSMLHFEMYAGTASGRLTIRGNKPFERRGDLIDPTSHLDLAVTE